MLKANWLIAVGACLTGMASFALNNIYWNGGESGSWNDPDNWNPKAVPVGAEYCAILTPRTADIEITVPDDIFVGQVLFGVEGEKQTDDDYFPMITLKGPGSITTDIGCYIYEKRRCRLDGLAFSPPDFWHNCTNYVIQLRNGATLNHKYCVYDRNGVLDIEDSTVNAERFNFYTNTTVRIVNGEVNISYEVQLGSVTNFTWDGGKITAYYPITDPRLVPDRVDETLVMTSPKHYIQMPTGPGTSYLMTGRMFQTNDTHSGGAIYATSDAYWHGGGEMYAEWFRFPYPHRTELALSKLCIGQSLYPNSTSTDSRIDIYGGIEFGAFGDWSSAPGDRVASIYLRGPIKVNTLDCFDGETLRTIDLRNLYPMPTAAFVADGGGVVTACVRSTYYPFDAVTVTNGTRLVIAWRANTPFVAQRLGVGVGSTLELTAGEAPVEVFETPTIDPAATVLVNLPSSPTAGSRYPILSSCATNPVDISRFVLNAADAGAWRIAESFGRVYLTDDVAVATAFDYEWTGTVSGNWNDPANWNSDVVPNANAALPAFRSGSQIAVTNDIDNLNVNNLRFYNGGPFTLSGLPIALKGPNEFNNTNASVYACGTAPVTIACDLTKSSGYLCFYVNNDTEVTMLGDITASAGLAAIGHVRFGGTIDTTKFYIFGSRGDSRATVATFLPGCKMTCSNQSINNKGGSMVVMDSAEVIYLKGYYHAESDRINCINGTIDVRSPTKYSGVGNQRYDGTGLLCIGMPVSHSGGSGTTWIGTGLTLRPGARWSTVTSDAADKYVRLGVDSFGTLSITNDFAYGPEPGLETTTTSADRALKLPRPVCTLTVDTQDPVTGEGHTATFEDPIIGYGKVVKRGAGTLVFASAENAVTGGVEIAEGTFTWTAPQTLTELTFGTGATLAFPASAPSLTVEKGLDLTGAVIDLSAVPVSTFGGWTEIIETDGAISGTPTFSAPGRFRCRVVANGDGGASLEVRSMVGTRFILR